MRPLTPNKRVKNLKAWCNWVKEKAEQAGHKLLEPMVRVARMVERHIEGILGHWKEGLTTASSRPQSEKLGATALLKIFWRCSTLSPVSFASHAIDPLKMSKKRFFEILLSP